MIINSVNGMENTQANLGLNREADSFSRNIENQIANAQKSLQELSSNEGLSLEEKMKKRQEIQKQIADLNNQLRQHKLEQRKEKQAGNSSMEDMLGSSKKSTASPKGKGFGFSSAGMQAMISADASMKQAKSQESVAVSMKGRAGVLEAEIKQDASRGRDVGKKKEELADMEEKMQDATASQIAALADAGKEMEKAAQAEETDRSTENEEDKKVDGEEKTGHPAESKTGFEAVSVQNDVGTEYMSGMGMTVSIDVQV